MGQNEPAYFEREDSKKKILKSTFYASDVLAIDYNFLHENGIKVVAFDVDGTLVKASANNIDIELAEGLRNKVYSSGIEKCFLASNSHRNLKEIADKIGASKIIQPPPRSPKPFKKYYTNLIKESGTEASGIVMVGDRYLQDIWGASRLGVKTVFVEMHPQGSTYVEKLFFRQFWQRKLVKRLAGRH